jgi:methylenetetrahydrofolate dehydrogenase (NADP+)/methenyltetrahydrofolate cyclohydrolase
MAKAQIIDGKAVAAGLRAALRGEVAAFARRHGRAPALRVVLVGDDPASRSYVRSKDRAAGEVGIDSALIELPATVTEAALLEQVGALNRDPGVHGILVQLPLPAQIDDARVIEAIDVAKDVDGFHPVNVGRLFSARGALDPTLLVPCTPRGCLILVQQTLGNDLAGRRVVVVGRSNIVGKPVAALFLGADCTVTLAHSKTRDLAA